MTIIQKQVFESNFNMIGYFLKEAYEKAKGKKKKEISNLIGNINEMYLYTNMLETENHIMKSREEEIMNEKHKWYERARTAENVIFKNDKTIKPEGI